MFYTVKTSLAMLYLVVFLLAISASATAADQAEAILQQAIELHKKGDMEAAVDRYRAYLKERPDSAQARSNLSVGLASLGYYDDAITEYTAALKREPVNIGIGVNLALAYYKTGQITAAAKHLSTLHTLS